MSVVIGSLLKSTPESIRRPDPQTLDTANASQQIPSFGDLLARLEPQEQPELLEGRGVTEIERGEQTGLRWPVSAEAVITSAEGRSYAERLGDAELLESFAGTGTLGFERLAVVSSTPKLRDPVELVQTERLFTAPDLSFARITPSSALNDTAAGLHDAQAQEVRGRVAYSHEPMQAKPAVRVTTTVTPSPELDLQQWAAPPIDFDANSSREDLLAPTLPPPPSEAHTQPIGVFVQVQDGLVKARAWLPACTPEELDQLNSSAGALMAEHGAAGGEFSVHETGRQAVQQRRG